MASMIRAFIAINLSLEIQQGLESLSRRLKEQPGGNVVRWVPVKNIHLTLKFLGDVSLNNLDMLKKIVRAETNRCPVFEISVGNLGAFPSTSRPRVVWVGVEAPQELYTLQRGIENEAAQLGYAPENRPFSPHLTLGRLSRNARTEQIRDVGESLVKYKIGFLGLTRVNEVNLYKSDLRPGGAVYTSIYASPLQSEGS